MNKPIPDSIEFVKVLRKDGQEFLQFLKKNCGTVKIINNRYQITYEDQFILFPLLKDEKIKKPLFHSLKKAMDFEIVSRTPIKNPNFKHKSINHILEAKYPKVFLELIPKSFDIIGRIIILEFNDPPNKISVGDMTKFKKDVAIALIKRFKNIRTVYEKSSEIKGPYRLRNLDLLGGKDKAETIYKENRCSFKIDIKETYFSPRLVFERKRISNLRYKKQEKIIDLFSGVGTFSIQIAALNDVIINAFDVNTRAIELMKENIAFNKLKGTIMIHNLDVNKLLNPEFNLGKRLKHQNDRIIMNLPEQSIEFLDVACFLGKKERTILHNYQFCEKPDPISKGVAHLEQNLRKINWSIEEIIQSKIVKAYSPSKELIVIDAKIKSDSR